MNIVSSTFVDHGTDGKFTRFADQTATVPIIILKFIIYESQLEKLHIEIESFSEEKISFTGSLSLIKEPNYPTNFMDLQVPMSENWAFDVSILFPYITAKVHS